MKANVPEKLYLFENPISGTPDDRWLSKRSGDTDVEYIRTDAFIEKARKWFEKQNEWRDINGIKHCDMESFEDFRKYMKEEPAPKIFEDMLNAKTPAESLGISAEEHDKIIDQCLYGKEPEMVDIDDLPKEEPVSDDLKEFEVEYIEREKENIVCVYDRHAGLVDGAKWQKEQLMAKAIDGGCFSFKNGYVHITDIKLGDKVKVIVIKED
jgi:hypothetical protein